MLGLSSAMMSCLHSSILPPEMVDFETRGSCFLTLANLSMLKENDCAAGSLILDLATDN